MKMKKTAVLLLVLLMIWAALPTQGSVAATAPTETSPETDLAETLPATGENFVAYLWLSLLPVVVGELLLAFRKKRSSKQKS